MILAPHPDDESLGCGGLLAALYATVRSGSAAPRPAHVVCMTDGGGSHPRSEAFPCGLLVRRRKRELIRALVSLGGRPDDATFLDYPDGWLGASDIDAAACAVVRICDRVRATALFSASPRDSHEDHKSTARIASVVHAARPRLRHWAYPVWSRWDLPDVVAEHAPAVARTFDTKFWQASKRRAIEAHESQLGRIVPDDPTGFTMEPAFIQRFVVEPELFFEVRPCQ